MNEHTQRSPPSIPSPERLVSAFNALQSLAPFSKTIHIVISVIIRLIRTLWRPGSSVLAKGNSQLSSLPLELIEAVLLELEWQDVLRARVTCRSLYEASKSLAVWRQLFRHLSESYAVPIIPPKPVEAYPADHLEILVMRWLCADSLWSPSVPRDPPVFRHVRQASPASNLVLVEGGRWLITSDDCDKGSIYSHLLDTENFSQTSSALFIQSSDDTFVSDMHAIVDHSSATLAFDLVVVYDDRKGASVPGRVEIWRVVETTDTALSSTRITSFTTAIPKDTLFYTSSSGTLYARFDGYRFVEVYDWSRSHAGTHHKCVIHAMCRGNKIANMTLLPGRKMLMIGYQSFSVISIPDLVTCSSDGLMPPPHQPPPLFHRRFDEFVVRDTVSTITSLGDDTYVAVATTKGIYLFHIHQDEVSLTLLYDIRLSSVPFPLGIHRAMMNRPPKGALAVLSFYKEATVKRYCTDDLYEAYGPRPAIDEWSARVVVYLSNGWISVVEGSPYPPSS